MKKLLLFTIALFALGACVEDNGNYKYTEVNEVETVLPKLYSRVYVGDHIIRIEPQLTQTLAENSDNLTYAWRHSTLSSNAARRLGEVESTAPYYDQVITAGDNTFNHYYWLEIHDALTGLTYPFETRIQIVKPFVNAWAVLHAGDDGAAKLGAIEYVLEDDPIPHTDIHAEFGYAPLTGQPVALGENNEDGAAHDTYVTPAYNLLTLLTDNAAESGAYAPWLKFQPYVSDVFIPSMVQNYASSGFNPALTTYVHKPQPSGGSFINDGALYHQSIYGLKVYKAKVDPAVAGEIDITHAARLGGITVMFDGAGRRFLYYANSSNLPGSRNVDDQFKDSDNTESIKPMSRTLNTIALDNIAHEVLFIGILPRYTASLATTARSFAIANGNDGKSYIYLFPRGTDVSNTGAASVSELRTINTPDGLDAASCFASGTQYNNMAFYSAGAAVYMLDFTTGVATLIYDHNMAGGGTVAAMRIARQEMHSSKVFDDEPYAHDLGRSLGVAINRGSSGELVV